MIVAWQESGLCGKYPGDGGSRRNEVRYACLSPAIDPVASLEFDVFLSHNSKDKEIVRKIAEALEGRGVRVWLDE
jgi:hypothetical protein